MWLVSGMYDIIFILNNHIFAYNIRFLKYPFLEVSFVNCSWYFVDHTFVRIHQFFINRTQIIKDSILLLVRLVTAMRQNHYALLKIRLIVYPSFLYANFYQKLNSNTKSTNEI